MTRALEVEPHDTATAETAPAVHEEALDSIFTWQELARLDEALTMASRETGLRSPSTSATSARGPGCAPRSCTRRPALTPRTRCCWPCRRGSAWSRPSPA